MNGKTGDKVWAINLCERSQIRADDVITPRITAGTENRTVLFGGAQVADQQILHHVSGRLRPALELISAKFNRASAENDAIIAIKVRSDGPGDEQGDRIRRRRLSGRRGGNVEHVVFGGTRAATS